MCAITTVTQKFPNPNPLQSPTQVEDIKLNADVTKVWWMMDWMSPDLLWGAWIQMQWSTSHYSAVMEAESRLTSWTRVTETNYSLVTAKPCSNRPPVHWIANVGNPTGRTLLISGIYCHSGSVNKAGNSTTWTPGVKHKQRENTCTPYRILSDMMLHDMYWGSNSYSIWGTAVCALRICVPEPCYVSVVYYPKDISKGVCLVWSSC